MAIRRIVNLPSIDKKKADILNNGIVTPETITDKYGDTKDGELFINKNVDNELLIAKNADGNYIAFEPSKAIDGKLMRSIKGLMVLMMKSTASSQIISKIYP